MTKIAPADGQVDRRSACRRQAKPRRSSARARRSSPTSSSRRARPPEADEPRGANRRVGAAVAEVISWKSQDGATIEGVYKPAGLSSGPPVSAARRDPRRPTGISLPIPFASTSIYPIDVWLGRGVLVLEPNYRGAPATAKFRALNVRNLGVGDAWTAVGHRRPGRAGTGRREPRRRDGLEPGGYLRLPRPTTARGSGRLGRRGHLRLDDVLREHGHHAVHAAVLKATPWDDPRSTRRRRR